jgi:AraC-like DNA-binding protein
VDGVTMGGFRRGMTPVDHRLGPHAVVMLALDFGADPPIVDDAGGRQHRGSLVAGLGFGGAVRIRGANIECVHVRLSPAVVRKVLGVSPAELEGAVVALDDLWGREVSRIREQLSAASSWEERFALTDAFLARRHEARSSIDPEVAWAWDRVAVARGQVRIEQLAAEVGWSRKRLWSRFHSQIGLPPKRAAKLVRFDRAVHRLAAGQDAARVAADGGYADQSHLHRDIMAFTGVTPATVTSESRRATAALAESAGSQSISKSRETGSMTARRAETATPVMTMPGPSWAMCTPAAML